MRILMVHNYYRQPGGEDEVFAAEAALLEQHGHSVSQLAFQNNNITQTNILHTAAGTVWNTESSNRMTQAIHATRPDIVHFHNTFPLVSPTAYDAPWRAGIPTVQTLHNYRLVCPNAIMYRNGRVCNDCVGKSFPWPGIVHACYRGSRPATAAVAAMLGTHRAVRTWQQKVSVYIALTEFARSIYVAGGLPEQRIVVKPNFIRTDPGKGSGGHGFLFVGRLTEEKGIRTLLEAWRLLNGAATLEIIGDGPLAAEVSASAGSGIRWLGRQPMQTVLSKMRESLCIIIPSLWYEAFPMTIVEAFAAGLPVIASNHGSLGGLIQHRRTGLHFAPGDSAALAAAVRWALDNPAALQGMRDAARLEYATKYTSPQNYELLMGIYGRALEERSPMRDLTARREDAVLQPREL
jgi:glycosyltransferase involved in cell wall biosynthesis